MAESTTPAICVPDRSQLLNQALFPNKRVLGLDPIFRSYVKMRIQDLKELDLVHVEDANNPSGKIDLYCFLGHAVNKVEVMGIVVMVDRKEKVTSFAIDDGTGVVLCMHWKSTRNDSKPELCDQDLPASLQRKYVELQAYDQSRDDVNKQVLGDLVQVRGWVTTYQDRREIFVLDYRKIDNPCVEMEAILDYRSIYKIYEKPFISPSVVTQQMAAISASTFNEFDILSAISGHIKKSGRSLTTVTLHDILLWPAVRALIPGFKEEEVKNSHREEEVKNSHREEEVKNSHREEDVKNSHSEEDVKNSHMEEDVKNIQEYTNIIKSVLQTLETTEGNIYQWSGTPETYEIIKSGCPMAGLVLSILKDACQIGKNIEDGCHMLHLKAKLTKCPKYCRVQDPVMMFLLSCLEESSDVFSTNPQRYMIIS